MDDIDDKALAVLEAEKARRLKARVDSGEVVVKTVTVVVGPDEDIEDAKARALARHSVSDSVHHDLFVIVSGVPRGPDYWKEETSSPQIQAASEEGFRCPPSEEPAGGGGVPSPSPPSQPTYVRVVISNGDEDDPGQIAEAWYTIEDDILTLRDADDKHITSRALLKGEDPVPLARILLREAEAPKDFQAPIRYPKMGFA